MARGKRNGGAGGILKIRRDYDGARAFAADSLVQGNTNGIFAASGGLFQTARNVVRENSTGLSLSGNGRLVATGNLVTRNSVGVSLGAGSTFLTRQDNTMTENGINSSGTGTITTVAGF